MSRAFAVGLCAVVMAAAAASVAIAQGPGMRGVSPRSGYSRVTGDAAKGKQLAEKTCVSCHGPTGNSSDPQFPKIAGQNPDYFYQQLVGFQTGARTSDVMKALVASLSQADMIDLARYYSGLSIKPDPSKDKALDRRGRQIYYGSGRPGVPPCAACHESGSGGGMGMMGGRGMRGGMGMRSMGPVPNLRGQHADYTFDQLQKFTSGARPASVMGQIATSLSTADKHAVAAYLSTLR